MCIVQGAAEGRVVLIGNIVKVSDKEESDRLRELYLSRHKDAFWVKFGDFSLYKMVSILAVRYVGGFARAGTCSAEDYMNACPDPIAPFAKSAMKHMNEDHADSIAAIVKRCTGIPWYARTMLLIHIVHILNRHMNVQLRGEDIRDG